MLKIISRWLEKRREQRFEKKIAGFLGNLADQKHGYRSFEEKENIPFSTSGSQLRDTDLPTSTEPPPPEPPPRQTIIENDFIAYLMSLPHSPKKDVPIWETMNGNQKIRIHSGAKIDSEGNDIPLPLPSRRFARLLLLFIFEEFQNQPEKMPNYGWEIDLGSGFCHFLKRIGVSHNGKQYKKIEDEIESLLSASFNGYSLMGNLYTRRDKRTVLRITENEFSNAMIGNSLQLDYEAFKDFTSSYEIDAFAFINDRFQQTQVKKHPKVSLKFESVKWKELHALNGQGIARERKYREKFSAGLSLAQQYYPAAKDVVKVDEKAVRINYKNVPPPIF